MKARFGQPSNILPRNSEAGFGLKRICIGNQLRGHGSSDHGPNVKKLKWAHLRTSVGANLVGNEHLGGDNSAARLDWISEFRQYHGRAPRILHIGNIANNSYNNAKILNQAGFDCDVLCPDYYHIMGCPEWEDADFSGDVRDHFRPDWHRLELQGFERPPWFAQGPLKLSIEYLIARRTGATHAAQRLWQQLAHFNKTTSPEIGSKPLFKIHKLSNAVRRISNKLQNEEAIERLAEKVYFRMAHILGMSPSRLPKLSNAVRRISNKLQNEEAIERLAEKVYFRMAHILGMSPSRLPKRGRKAFRLFARLVASNFRAVVMLLRQSSRFSEPNVGDPYPKGWEKEFCAFFREAFPERKDQLSEAEVSYFASGINHWRELFSHYDVIQAYSTDVIYPMLAKTPYIGFEHGTLREIPFENNATGRLTALGYHRANAVLVTNSDCLDNAYALSTGPVRFINHPYDEDHGLNVEGVDSLRQTLCEELQADFLIFFPTRQDWVASTGYADKANDLFLRGFAQLRKSGYAVGMVCCEWGSNVEQSKTLLRELEVEQYVQWRQPMAIVRFERHAAACDLTADQFKLGAFGGVLFKAMSIGVPVCTYLDGPMVAGSFPEIPPVVNCQTVEEIVISLEKLIRSRGTVEDYGLRGRSWIKSYHSGLQTVTTQADLYRSLLDITVKQ